MTSPVAGPARRPPRLLAVGAVLAGLEGLVLLGYAVLEVANAHSDRVGLAIATSLFFTLMGGALVLCAHGLWQVSSWARSPLVVGQLIAVLTAWSFLGGDTTGVAVSLGSVSVAVLVCLLHPRSTEALAAAENEEGADERA